MVVSDIVVNDDLEEGGEAEWLSKATCTDVTHDGGEARAKRSVRVQAHTHTHTHTHKHTHTQTCTHSRRRTLLNSQSQKVEWDIFHKINLVSGIPDLFLLKRSIFHYLHQ